MPDYSSDELISSLSRLSKSSRLSSIFISLSPTIFISIADETSKSVRVLSAQSSDNALKVSSASTALFGLAVFNIFIVIFFFFNI